MAYRNIVIDGKDYHWVVGRKNVKIRSDDRSYSAIFDRQTVAIAYEGCQCGCGQGKGLAVEPSTIRQLVRGLHHSQQTV
jgi:hypothetical protein